MKAAFADEAKTYQHIGSLIQEPDVVSLQPVLWSVRLLTVADCNQHVGEGLKGTGKQDTLSRGGAAR